MAGAWYFLTAEPDVVINPQSMNEVRLSGRSRLLPNWEVGGDWRYDINEDRIQRANLGIAYGNECAEIDLSFSSRFDRGSSVPSSTSVEIAVRLVGLGASPTRSWPQRACRR
jgi:LPS-assembly protein